MFVGSKCTRNFTKNGLPNIPENLVTQRNKVCAQREIKI